MVAAARRAKVERFWWLMPDTKKMLTRGATFFIKYHLFRIENNPSLFVSKWQKVAKKLFK